EPPPPPPPRRTYRRREKINGMHYVPAGLLAFVLLVIVACDALWPRGKGGEGGGTAPQVIGQQAGKHGFESWDYASPLHSREPLIGVQFSDMQRFGILLTKEKDPENPNEAKRLTFDASGRTNNTRIWVDGYDYMFGATPKPGTWVGPPGRKLEGREAHVAVCEYGLQKIRVTQLVEIVPGEESRLLDTCLVYYLVENKSEVKHDVGLGVMLDTFIGANDGVPFLISGEQEFVTTKREFRDDKEVPDYIEAYERQNLKDPGTVARMQLKGLHLPDVELEPVDHMYLCRYPGNSSWPYDAPKPLPAMNEPPGAKKDSCVFL